MAKFIRRYISSCDVCPTKNSGRHKARFPQAIPVPHRAMIRLILDTVGPLVKPSGNKHVLIVSASRAVLSSQKLQETIQQLRLQSSCYGICLRYGFAVRIRSDRGTEFVNEVIAHVLKMPVIWHMTSTAYRPSRQKRLERQHQSIAPSVPKLRSQRQSN